MISKKEFLAEVQKHILPLLHAYRIRENRLLLFSFVVAIMSGLFTISYIWNNWNSLNYDDIKDIGYWFCMAVLSFFLFIASVHFRKVKKNIRPFLFKIIGVKLTEDKLYLKNLEKLHFLPNSALKLESQIMNEKFYLQYKSGSFYVQEISYLEAHDNRSYYFKGPLIRFVFSKSFYCTLLLLNNKALLPRDKTALSIKEKVKIFFQNQGLAPLLLESTDFNKKYHSFTNDQIKARTILTPAFMEKINYLEKIYSAPANILFDDNQLILVINTQKNMFEFPLLSKSKIEDFAQFYDEIDALYKFIDFFEKENKI